MRRPTVLHVARDWVRPSERFVSDVVRSVTATRPVVACGSHWPDGPAAALATRRYELDRWLAPLPWSARQRGRRGLLAAIGAFERAAVVHAHFGYWAELAGPAARRLGRPWMVSLHGHDLLVEARDDGDQLSVLRDADLVVVPSDFLAGVAADLGLRAERLRVIPSGIDIARLPFRERRPDPDGAVVITFAGRFVEKKGVVPAARALVEIHRRHPQVVARFVGFGPLGDDLRRVLERSDLPSEVIDGTRPDAVLGALASTHLVLTPSRTAADGDAETLGLVNLEAQACGIPVVSTVHGGIPGAVAPDGALLVDEGDDRGLVAALDAVVSAPERWPAMGRAGREHVALHFELGSRVADLEEQYLHLARHGVAGPPPPRPRSAWPTVTVVVPTYQRRELLGRTLDALERQTYPSERLEVIVVDDGSSDGTAGSLAERDPPWTMTVLRNETNSSAAAARNRAVATAHADVLAFTDDDCRPVPTWLESLVAGLRTGVDLVQGLTRPDPDLPLRPLSRSQWTLAETGLYETCNIAYLRQAIERVEPPPFRNDLLDDVRAVVGVLTGNLGFAEDTQLGWRVRRSGGRTRFAPHAVVHHHVFPPDPGYVLRRAALSAGFPYLVRSIPEFRGSLWHGYGLAPRRIRFLAAATGTVLAVTSRRMWVALAAPYVWDHVRPGRAELRGRLKALPVLAVRDAIETAALLYGSARARRLVL